MIRFAISALVTVGFTFAFISESHAITNCSIACSSCPSWCNIRCDNGTPGHAFVTTCGEVGMCKAKSWNCSSAREPGPFAALLGADPADQSVPPTCKLEAEHEEREREPAPKAPLTRPVARPTISLS